MNCLFSAFFSLDEKSHITENFFYKFEYTEHTHTHKHIRAEKVSSSLFFWKKKTTKNKRTRALHRLRYHFEDFPLGIGYSVDNHCYSYYNFMRIVSMFAWWLQIMRLIFLSCTLCHSNDISKFKTHIHIKMKITHAHNSSMRLIYISKYDKSNKKKRSKNHWRILNTYAYVCAYELNLIKFDW